MEDRNLTIFENGQEASKGPHIKLEALLHRHEILDAELTRSFVEVEIGIVDALQIGDRYVEIAAVQLLGREENGLLRATTDATATSQLQDVSLLR
jgi:hypothetical protein